VSRNKFNSIPAAYVLLAIALLTSSAVGQLNNGVMSPPANSRPPRLENVGIEQHLDAQVPPDLTFRDDTGRTVKLGDYFGHKPLILNLVYYNCTMLCGEALAGLASAMRLVKFNVGDLTGEPDSINALTKAVGFQYQYDARTNQYAHATAIMVLTPQGRISRYFYGVDFPPKDLRMGLVEASQGKIGNVVDAVLLYCYHYDPETGKYGAMVANILRLAAAATILMLGGLIFTLWRLDRSVTRRTIHGGARTL